MADAHQLDVEVTHPLSDARLKLNQFAALDGVELLELGLEQPQRQAGAIHPDGDLLHQVGHGPDVVFVAVGEHDARELLDMLEYVRHVGQDDVHAGVSFVGEHHAAVYGNHAALPGDQRHVHADVAGAAQRDEPHRILKASQQVQGASLHPRGVSR